MPFKNFVSDREHKALMGLLALGALGFAAGLISHSARLWPSFLLNAFYFLTLALGAMVFVSIHHVSNAGWSTVIRRIPEAMMGYLPLGAAMMLFTFFGRQAIYRWTHEDVVHSDGVLSVKAWLLNTPSFYARMAIILAIWIAFMVLLRRESLWQDEDGRLEHTMSSKKISAVFLVVFALTFPLASFDWLMSVEPEFYSTIYAFYCFSGLFVSGIAAIAILVIWLRRRGVLPEVGEEHLHNLGKLIFGFTTFWAYIWISQYLLIYYANLPEETIYYIRQMATPGWYGLFLLNLFLNWIIPFVILLPRSAKRREGWLMTACLIVLVGHWLDLYLMILPQVGAAAMISPYDLTLGAGFTALFLYAFLRGLKQAALLPVHDPYLQESLALHAHEEAEAGVY
ncbi:MAG: hypothetical protein D6723_15290 [Acidobacteria bacterium]|nr:MAG: hypothetical protein D6723_15290 [Acidobacteriota bacterium]